MSLVLGHNEKRKAGLEINYIQSKTYDRINDILYIKFASTSMSYGDETEDGVVVMRDIITDEVTGVTIMYPKRDYAIRVQQLKRLGLDVDISI